ncbi:MAG: aldehyde dehydrogenase family protein [Myxococcales bacterium]|nr:aldehyde dehydrogenase family protein [Myxococcales bacterium]MCB9646681.1 aldehyde dehydrogenase family protein [Deltaproteobacteria bacterium]
MRERRRRAETLVRIQKERIPHLFVGGLDVESEANATLLVTNPADKEPLGRCPAANARDVHKAVEAARGAFEATWRDTSARERGRALVALAEAVEHRAEDLAILEALQTGKTFREVLDEDILRGARALRHFAGWADKHPGELVPLEGGIEGRVHREPVGVVASVLPWSAPFLSAMEKVGAALISGSTLLLQPPEQAPLTVLALGEMTREANLPPGVLNVITGTGSVAGEALATHPLVGVMTFAGPMDWARRMLLGAAKSNLKPVHFELGDKTPCIVFEDADRRAALEAVATSIFTSRAVLPTAASRLLVHESHYEEAASVLAARAKQVVVGDALDEHTELGPMISEEHLKRVLAYVELGRREGAKLVAGGVRDTDGAKAMGAFMRPTVFVDAKPKMRVTREEIAGPVLTITPFKSEDEAVALANDTDYGLAAAVWTKDLARAQRVGRRLQAGVVWINGLGQSDPALPFGGTRLSGQGRSYGREALQQLTRTRSVYVSSK